MSKRPLLEARVLQPLLTVEQVAEYLQVSVRTVRRYVDQRRIGVYAFSRTLRFAFEDVETFVSSSKRSCIDKNMYERKKNGKQLEG